MPLGGVVACRYRPFAFLFMDCWKKLGSGRRPNGIFVYFWREISGLFPAEVRWEKVSLKYEIINY